MNLDKEIIQINNITKDYGNNHGDFDINLKIHENEVVGIAGENGAGKTTLIRRRMGFIHRDGGNIKIHQRRGNACRCRNRGRLSGNTIKNNKR